MLLAGLVTQVARTPPFSPLGIKVAFVFVLMYPVQHSTPPDLSAFQNGMDLEVNGHVPTCTDFVRLVPSLTALNCLMELGATYDPTYRITCIACRDWQPSNVRRETIGIASSKKGKCD